MRGTDAAVGRWISEDPIGFRGRDVNVVRYVGNAPNQFVDPTGLAVPIGAQPGGPVFHPQNGTYSGPGSDTITTRPIPQKPAKPFMTPEKWHRWRGTLAGLAILYRYAAMPPLLAHCINRYLAGIGEGYNLNTLQPLLRSYILDHPQYQNAKNQAINDIKNWISVVGRTPNTYWARGSGDVLFNGGDHAANPTLADYFLGTSNLEWQATGTSDGTNYNLTIQFTVRDWIDAKSHLEHWESHKNILADVCENGEIFGLVVMYMNFIEGQVDLLADKISGKAFAVRVTETVTISGTLLPNPRTNVTIENERSGVSLILPR